MSGGTLHVPARDIPVPTSISPEAQAIVAMGSFGEVPPWPALDDTEGWTALVKLSDDAMLTMADTPGTPMSTLFGSSFDGAVETLDLGSFVVHVVTPDGFAPDDRRVYLDIHGGAWVLGGGAVCRRSAQLSARNVQSLVWSVDYRMPPDHPYPTPLDDCLATYRRLLEEREPDEIVVGGSSAGGNLAAALIVRARDEGLPMPAAVVLETGAFDLTASGDSFRTNLGLDPVLAGDFTPTMRLYAGSEDLEHPYASPLFADLTGFPPAILTTGTRDLLLSDSVRMHRALRAAGVRAELHVWEAGGHGLFFNSAPEDADKVAEVRRFLGEHWPAG